MQKSYLYSRHEQIHDQIEVTINGLRMNSVVFPLLGSVPDNLDGFHSLVQRTTPVEEPHLIQMRDIVESHWELICDYDLGQMRGKSRG